MGNILLTGKPGIGKTTLVRKVVEQLGNIKAGGFYTQEIRENSVRVGFRITTLDGRRGILAHVNHKGKFRVGKYGVNLGDIDEIAVSSILNSLDRDLILIDEIGKMELYSEKFKEVVVKALETGRVLGTIRLGRDEFTNEIKKRNDTRIIEVTLENRDPLVEELVQTLT